MLFKFVTLLAFVQMALAAYSNSTDISTSVVVVTSTLYGTVTELTTYCPFPTEITTNGATYSVTAATTLTITDCPCVHASVVTYTETVLCSSGSTISTLPGSTPTLTPPAPMAPSTTAPVPTTPAAISTFEGAGYTLLSPFSMLQVAVLLICYLML